MCFLCFFMRGWLLIVVDCCCCCCLSLPPPSFQVLVPPKNKAVNSMPQLGIEFRQDPWLSVGIVSKSNIYMSVQVQMVDFMAERLARKEEEEFSPVKV